MEVSDMAFIRWDLTHSQQPAGRSDCLIHSLSMMIGKSYASDDLTRRLSSGRLSNLDMAKDIGTFADRHKLEFSSIAQSHSLGGMTEMLKRGPILAFGQLTPDRNNPIAPGSSGHAFVIAGVRGNDILIHDPNEHISYWQDYGKTMQKQPWATLFTFQTKQPWK